MADERITISAGTSLGFYSQKTLNALSVPTRSRNFRDIERVH